MYIIYFLLKISFTVLIYYWLYISFTGCVHMFCSPLPEENKISIYLHDFIRIHYELMGMAGAI